MPLLEPNVGSLCVCVCVCAGVPNTGKSEFIDSIVLSLALNHYWPICFASFEKRPAFHFRDLAEKIWGKPFNNRDGLDGPTMTQREARPSAVSARTLCWATVYIIVQRFLPLLHGWLWRTALRFEVADVFTVAAGG